MRPYTFKVIRSYISNKANPNFLDSDGTSLLMMAAEKGDHELVKILIDQNCKINLRNKDQYFIYFRKNALFFAIDNPDNSENTDVVIILLRNNIDKENPNNMTPLSKSV